MTETVTISAHAKINLFLRILGRENTGMHGIETLFALVELADTIAVSRIESGVEIEVDGPDTGPPADNLAVRAARALLAATGDPFGVRIKLIKRIPAKAGLGGGSSDAAATLHAVNTLAGKAVPEHEVLQLASKLGSDVPFFASGAAMALAWNHGERLFRLTPPNPAPVLLAIPHCGVSTPEAYSLWDRGNPEPKSRGSVMLDTNALQTWGGIGRLGGNDFESVVWAREPQIRQLFERVAATRPLAVRMSGSGSAILGIYRSSQDLDDAISVVGTRRQHLIKTATRSNSAAGALADAAQAL